MQNLNREIESLRASIGRKVDWTRRRALPKGYTVHVGPSTVALTEVKDIAAAAMLTAGLGRDVALTLYCGATNLGTVSVDRYTYAWAASRRIDPDGFVPRALLAHLWASH